MKATVNKDLCISCGLCPDICPEVFQMADDDKAEAIVDEVPAGSEAACRDAAEQCPSSAISVDE
jgi:ferredoxin